MSTKRPLAPSFLDRVDRYLLLNKPEIWSARTHLVLYYGILFIALLTVISFIVPDDPRTESTAPFWMGFVWLISFVSFIGWLIYLLRFNVFKRYGLISPVNSFITFILYFITIGVFVLFGYVKPYVETIRANAAYTEQELVNDANTFNLGVARLTYDSLDHRWTKDSALVVDTIPDDDPSYTEVVDVNDTTPALRKITRSNLLNELGRADSVQKLNDSTYYIFHCPSYQFLHPYRLSDHYDSMILSAVDIYRKVIVGYTRPKDTMPIFKEVTAIKKKYQTDFDPYDYYERTELYQRIEKRYGIRDVASSMSNILERKHRWDESEMPVYIRLFYYPALILSLLVFSFRHSTAKTFFLTILTGVILIVLTSLAVAFTGYGEDSVLNYIISYFLVALLLSFTAFSSKTRNVFSGISINLCLWLLPFIPLCIVARHYIRLRRYEIEDYEKYYEQQHLHTQLAEIAGLVLVLVLIGTFFHRAYRKWYAAPEG